MAWNDLTDRQKQLDRAIDGCGVNLDSSNRCLKKVMESIGAHPNEEAFVRERIALRLRTQQQMNDTDRVIDSTSRTLDIFEKEDARWEALGKKLGIDL